MKNITKSPVMKYKAYRRGQIVRKELVIELLGDVEKTQTEKRAEQPLLFRNKEWGALYYRKKYIKRIFKVMLALRKVRYKTKIMEVTQEKVF